MENYVRSSEPEGSKPQRIYLGRVHMCTVEILALSNL